jgi:neutral ceramidase
MCSPPFTRSLARHALIGLLGWACLTAGTSAAEFRVGFAQADITPPVGWRRAGGFSELISTGVHDPLLTKAMVVQDGATAFAFVGNDLCSVPRDLTDLARRRASQKTGIPAANIIITATHTHGGPEYTGPLRDFLHARASKTNHGRDPHEPMDYRGQLVERWVNVLTAAWSNRQPASLEFVIPRLEGFAHNRRYWMKDGSVGWIPRKGDPNLFRPAGPVDTDLPFLLARRAGRAEAIGSLTVFAMHTAVYGGPPFSADFPGHLQRSLNGTFGPQFVSLFGEGCAGDVNHLDPFSQGPQPWTTVSPAVGRAMAATALKSLPYASAVKPGSLAVRSTTIRSPVPPITDAEYEAAKQLMETLDQNGAAFLVIVDAWRKIFRKQFWQQHGRQFPQEVQAVRFDADTALVALPHEVFTELGMTIKAASPFRRTMVVTLANDIDFYLPTRRAFEEGNYEPTTCPLAPGCGERLVAAAVQLLNELKPGVRGEKGDRKNGAATNGGKTGNGETERTENGAKKDELSFPLPTPHFPIPRSP